MGLTLRDIEQVFQIGNTVSSGPNKKTLKTERYPDHLYRIHALQSQLSATEIRFRSNLPPNTKTIVAFTAHMAILYMFRSLKIYPLLQRQAMQLMRRQLVPVQPRTSRPAQ